MNKLRRSMLYCPANNPKFYYYADFYGADCVIFDLEDSIEYAEKDSARDLLVEAMHAITFEHTQVFVRVNGANTVFFESDLRAVIGAGIKYIRLPMCESVDSIQRADAIAKAAEKAFDRPSGSAEISTWH